MNPGASDDPGATLREYAPGQRVFGRYTLRKILGRGGMGIVWLARDEELERDVALKFLPDLVVLDRAMVSELKRETRRSLELTHKNIVRIHDFVQSESSACISMEYIDGDTLSNLRAEKDEKVFQPEEIAAWTAQLCDALDYAHNHARIIHRDLKPANLMVNQKGDLKVSDFGIARSLGDSMSKLTLASAGTSGTLVYMSPQQLDGERGTHLDDVYSLGATLYDLLTSKPPFYSGNIDRQVHERTAPSMTERRREFNIEPALVPPVWEETVAACLAKDPARRPQAALEIAQRLQLAPTQAGTVGLVSGKRTNKVLLVGAGIGALLLLTLGGWYLTRQPSKQSAAARKTAPTSTALTIPEKSIAVLPFENLSKDEENAFFAGGVQDEILTNLARIADLKVISRTSVMNYKAGTARNIREIAHALGVAHILEGSVQRAANRVRVNAQLIDARTDAHIWAEHYDKPLDDVFAIQSEIARAIADQLQAKISTGEKAAVAERPTSDLVAYDLYLRAATLLDDAALEPVNKEQEKHFFQAVELLNQAIARDPAFLLAYCRLALAHDELYFGGHDHTPARLALANSAINAAFRLKPDSGEAHLARATHFYHGYLDYDHARDELAIAARTLPNNARIFEWTGYIDRRQGRWHDAARNLQRASELDPRNVRVLGGAAVTYNSMSDYGQARATLDRLIAVELNDDYHLLFRAWIDVAERADTRPLHAVIEKILRDDPAGAGDVVGDLFFLARAEHDPVAADRALAALTALTENTRVGKGRVNLSRYYLQGLVARMKGDTVAARVAFTAARAQQEEAVRARPDDGSVLCVLGLIDAALGRKEEALREARQAVELLPVSKNALDGPAVLYFYAVICAWTGERDLAIEQLETLAKIPAGASYGELRLDPDLDPLRGDPRFEKIVASVAPKSAR